MLIPYFKEDVTKTYRIEINNSGQRELTNNHLVDLMNIEAPLIARGRNYFARPSPRKEGGLYQSTGIRALFL
jgi:hypothetical protein